MIEAAIILAVLAGLLAIGSGFPNAPGWLLTVAVFLIALGLALVGTRLGQVG